MPKLPFAIATIGFDGKATLAEFPEMYSNQFDGLEKNEDGLLTVEEIYYRNALLS
ncbi:MAG: hypothetical protein KAY65_11115 [Planctomycetes bacterium]|nr:hypothetical protein [Planctomycetota bacterium]